MTSRKMIQREMEAVPTLCEAGKRDGECDHRGCVEFGWPDYPALAQAVWKEWEKEHLDNPEFDATDAAHPAWWRGHDHTTQVFCDLVVKILDGKDDGGGANHEPWGVTRRRVLALRAERDALRAYYEASLDSPCDWSKVNAAQRAVDAERQAGAREERDVAIEIADEEGRDCGCSARIMARLRARAARRVDGPTREKGACEKQNDYFNL